jgi:uncharacterized membrane protein YgcG
MRRAAVLAVGLLASLSIVGAATLRVDSFDAQISLDTRGSLHVIENLTVTFTTPHHGIEREIPISYRVPAVGTHLSTGFTLDRVLLDARAVPYTSRRVGQEQYLRIGDPDRTIVGTYVYTIAYTVERAILFHEDYLQIYWNVTGTDWRVPVDRVTAVVSLPDEVDLAAVSSTSYIGYRGSSARGGAARVSETGGLIFETTGLAPGEGLTIDLAIPRDQVSIEPPSIGRRIVWFLDANKFAALPILVLVGMLLVWHRVGRDPRKGIIAPAFEPPPGMHPGEAGVLIDDRIDLRDVSAMVVGLAVAGCLRIEEVRDEDPGPVDRLKNLFGRPTPDDYRFVRQPASTRDLSAEEEAILDAVFDEAHREERTLSSLENDFYKHLPTIRTRLYDRLIKKGLYPHNPERTRRFYANVGFLGLAAGIGVGVALASLYLGLAVAVSALIVLAFSPIMPRKTKRGVRALEDVLGLAEYIRRAEVDRIEFHDAPERSPALFEKLLPYAIALNLTRIWTRQFEGLLAEPPEWYVGGTSVFRGHLFALSMMHLSSGMERTFASAPRTASGGRSAWGGRGSFGGGFSGGGFGGGGGGGW